jgi:predicted peptidase
VLANSSLAQSNKSSSKNWNDLYEAHHYKEIPYRLLKPIDFQETEKASYNYPIILTLHGAGGKGDDNKKQLKAYNFQLAKETLRKKYPCFVLAPQSLGPWRMPGPESVFSPEELQNASPLWQKFHAKLMKRSSNYKGRLDEILELLDTICENYPIDRTRIYVLGHSMGGAGSWNVLAAAPDKIAAAVPSAGPCFLKNDLSKFAHVPIWFFHGDKDKVVPVEFSRQTFGQLKAIKANAKYTELVNTGHGSSQKTFTYNEDSKTESHKTEIASDRVDKTGEIWSWLFAQRNQSNRKSNSEVNQSHKIHSNAKFEN